MKCDELVSKAYHDGYLAGRTDLENEIKLDQLSYCSWCGGNYTVVDNDYQKYVPNSEVKYCFHCGKPVRRGE